ncbi:hypothetical protein M885DRAFT_510651 [Pelagophyceae sp. CCMP2097]|nr:hypothetical protein M885DRAFT_510651 [Pelagophyceae sp. CCMP2097]
MDDPLGEAHVSTLPPIESYRSLETVLSAKTKAMGEARSRSSQSATRQNLYSSPYTVQVATLRFDPNTTRLQPASSRKAAAATTKKLLGAARTGPLTLQLKLPGEEPEAQSRKNDLLSKTAPARGLLPRNRLAESESRGNWPVASGGRTAESPGGRPAESPGRPAESPIGRLAAVAESPGARSPAPAPGASSREGPSKRDKWDAPGAAKAKAAVAAKKFNLAASVQRIRNYTMLLEKHSLHHFVIWKGKRLDATPEFVAFRRRYAVRWPPISHLVGLLEKALLEKGMELALVDGAALDALARCDVARLKPADLWACVHNVDGEADDAVGAPRPAAVSGAAPSRAVAAVQRAMRGKLGRLAFALRLRRLSAAVTVQSAARCFLAQRRVVAGLHTKRALDEARWQALMDQFRSDAPRKMVRGQPRVEVHLPSVGHAEHARLNAGNFALEQALQITRLCRADVDVHVVYVSPLALDDEVLAYYDRLLALDGTARRFTLVVPENARRFPAHATLAAVAWYSPACLRRLRSLVKNRFAYVVPGGPCGAADKAVALHLGVPLLGADPSAAAAHGSRSGAKRLLRDADVNVPVGAHDIYDDGDFLIALAKLAAAHLDVGRWKFGVDADAGASGVAYLDVDEIEVVRDLRRERNRLQNADASRADAAWHRPDVQVLARARLLRAFRADLATRAVVCYPGRPAATDAQREWAGFAGLLRRYGAVIEAEPRSIAGRPAVHALIRPDGAFSVVAVHDVVTTARYERVATLCPATSAPAAALVGATAALCRKLHEAGVCGHVTLHFAAFRAAPDKPLRLWATDLELGLNAFSAGHGLHAHVAGDAVAAYVLVPRLRHAGLAATTLPAFFKLCRVHGVAFDLSDRRGPVFVLVDALAAGCVGALVQGRSRADALGLATQLFAFLKQHVRSRHDAGAPRDIELDEPGDLDEIADALSALAPDPRLRR